MTQYSNSAEGGSNGTAVTAANSGGVSGDAWDIVNNAGGSPITYSNTQVMHGNLAYKFNLATSSNYLDKALPSGSTSHAFRFYIYLAANPSSLTQLLSLIESVSQVFSLGINSSRQIFIQDSSFINQALVGTLALNTWYRIEGTVSASTPTNGSCTVNIYVGDSATIFASGSQVGDNFGSGNITHIRYYGLNSPVVFYLDDIAENDTGTLIGAARITITVSRTFKWNVKVQVLISRIFKWNTKAIITATRSLLWNTKQTISTSRIFKWNTRTAVTTISRIFKWNVEQQILVSRVFLWNTGARVQIDRVLLWNTRTIVPTIHRVFKWNTRVSVPTISRIFKWKVRESIIATRIFKWDTYKGIVISRIFLWNVGSRIKFTRTFLWNVFRGWQEQDSVNTDWTELEPVPEVWTELDHANTGWH